MADEGSRAVSEQQEGLDRGTADHHLSTGDATGPQYTDDDGDLTDDEPRAVADEAGRSYPLGPEQAAMHIEDEDGRQDE
ncbi:hypothetical protein AB0G02_23000 [Actinosynnema sp. NPDC023658]|uniref:hypothetical protein n=1 Tax=Actinosynnema sp. NPDC023658 TaxID=3155465 RepID=UPI0033C1294D